MRNYKNYSVWEKGHKLTLDVYQIVANYPQEELYSLVSQMKRSSSSLPTNIAEGCGRKSDKDFARFPYIAFGSANELEYQILLSIDLNFITEAQGKPLMFQVEEIKKNAELFNSKIKLNAKS